MILDITIVLRQGEPVTYYPNKSAILALPAAGWLDFGLIRVKGRAKQYQYSPTNGWRR
ncbi:MAG TPA: hypothetical protein VLT36_10175 [Candidatus Dormibacteraeota bacterium]|nr:hypothetical protein [Candidatus Dormibacteraeota bacterium]